MSHKSALRTLIAMSLVVFFALNLSACKTVGDLIWSVVPTPDLSAYTVPIESTPVGIYSFPTSRPPASVGEEQTVGNLSVSVRRVVRPANSFVGKGLYTQPKEDEEYLLVEINVRCTSDSESCRATEFDFGVSGNNKRDYVAEFSSSFSDGVEGLFEGGEIEAGQSMSGNIIFIIAKDDSDLILTYPRMYNFGTAAQFLLDQ
jgi:hypothetical protein